MEAITCLGLLHRFRVGTDNFVLGPSLALRPRYHLFLKLISSLLPHVNG